MSTGKRYTGKRSIVGSRICAPGKDGKYYPGVIQSVKNPDNLKTFDQRVRYTVCFEMDENGKYPFPKKAEYFGLQLIGSGFLNINDGIKLIKSQKVYLTYNGREISAEVISHRHVDDEVDVIAYRPEGSIRLTKKIDDIRLMQSRKSKRLADSDVNFARLADVSTERRRNNNNNNNLVESPKAKKRKASSSNELDRMFITHNDIMDEESAALVLTSLAIARGIKINSDGSSGSETSDASSSGNGCISELSLRSETPFSIRSDESGSAPGSTTWINLSSLERQSPPRNDADSTSGPISSNEVESSILKIKMEAEEDISKIDMASSGNPVNILKKDVPQVIVKEIIPQTLYQCGIRCNGVPCGKVKMTYSDLEEHVRKDHVDSILEQLNKSNSSLSSDNINKQNEDNSQKTVTIARPMDHEYSKNIVPVSNLRSNSIPIIDQSVVSVTPTFSSTPPLKVPISFQQTYQEEASKKSGIDIVTVTLDDERRAVKKCRKVHGVSGRDKWCTSCKWKKACTRFVAPEDTLIINSLNDCSKSSRQKNLKNKGN